MPQYAHPIHTPNSHLSDLFSPILTCPTSSLQSSDRCTSDFERVRFGVEDEVVLAVVFDLPDVVLEGDEC